MTDTTCLLWDLIPKSIAASVGLAFVVDCFLRKIPTLLVKFRIGFFVFLSFSVPVILVPPQLVFEFVIMEGVRLACGYAALLYSLENIVEVNCQAARMEIVPTWISVFFKAMRVVAAAGAIVTHVYFAVNLTNGAAAVAIWFSVVFTFVCFPPLSLAFFQVYRIISKHADVVGPGQLKEIKRRKRQLIAIQVSLGTLPYLLVAFLVIGITDPSVDRSERFQLPECEIDGVEVLLAILYGTLMFTTRVKSAAWRPWFHNVLMRQRARKEPPVNTQSPARLDTQSYEPAPATPMTRTTSVNVPPAFGSVGVEMVATELNSDCSSGSQRASTRNGQPGGRHVSVDSTFGDIITPAEVRVAPATDLPLSGPDVTPEESLGEHNDDSSHSSERAEDSEDDIGEDGSTLSELTEDDEDDSNGEYDSDDEEGSISSVATVYELDGGDFPGRASAGELPSDSAGEYEGGEGDDKDSEGEDSKDEDDDAPGDEPVLESV